MAGTEHSPDPADGSDGFDRLESAVEALVESHQTLQSENAAIRRELDAATQRVKTLDGELIAANQRRQDACKRIDELIAHLDQLDSQLDEQLDVPLQVKDPAKAGARQED